MSGKTFWICALVLALAAGGLFFLAPGEPLLRLGLWGGVLLIYGGLLGLFGLRFAVEGLLLALLLWGLAALALFGMARVRAVRAEPRTGVLLDGPDPSGGLTATLGRRT